MINPDDLSEQALDQAIDLVSARFADLVAQDVQHNLLDDVARRLFAAAHEKDFADCLLEALAQRCGEQRLLYLGMSESAVVRSRGYEQPALRRLPARSLFRADERGLLDSSCLALALPADAPHTAGIALRWRGSVLAVVALERPTGGPMIGDFLERLAERAGQALEGLRQRLHGEAAQRALSRQRQEAQKQIHLLEDWNQVLSRLEGRYQQLEQLLVATVATLGGEKGSLMLLDEHTHELVVRATCGLDPELEDKIRRGEHPCKRLKLGEGVAGKVAQSLQPMVVNQVDREPVFLEPELSQVTSIVCLPLHVDGLALGVLNITNKGRGKRFQAQHLEAGMKLARRASRAINQSRLYHLAVLDPVTEVYSRSHLYQRIHDELARARRYTRHVSLLAVTLQGLEVVRGHQSHEAGNQVEIHVAQILRECTRETDLVARLGEYSFAVLMPETDALSAMFAAERICQQSRESELLRLYYVTAHVGICSYPDRAESVPRLVARAEQAMLAATRSQEGLPVVLAPLASSNAEAAPALNWAAQA